MKYFTYDIKKYNFRPLLCEILKNSDLENLHKLVDYPELFPRKFRLSNYLLFFISAKLSDLVTTVSEYSKNSPRMRLTLDYEEDYLLLKSIQAILGSKAKRKEIDDLFLTNPDLYKINWFRNKEWKQAQLDKKI